MRLLARISRVVPLLLMPFFAVGLTYARTCYSAEDAGTHAEKDICVAAHVYRVVETSDGTRLLDVCKPGVEEKEDREGCHLVIVSLAVDRNEVGELNGLTQQDIEVRGNVHILHGQATMILSHARQLHDGPEKFRPNPSLLTAFNASAAKPAFRDPALTGHSSRGGSTFKGSRQ